MSLIDPSATVIIVVGSAVRDRPAAEELSAEVTRRGAGVPARRAVVVDDDWFFRHDQLHAHAVIAIGGPGANGVTGQLVPTLPVLWSDGDVSFVQAGQEGPPRVALWGVNRDATAAAIARYLEGGGLDELLTRLWGPVNRWVA